VVGLAVACGDDGSSPSEPTATSTAPAMAWTPDLEVERPPPLEVSSAYAAVEAGLGTYCWSGSPGTSLCVDKIGPITNAEPLVVIDGRLEASLGGEAVEEVSVTAQRVGGADGPERQELDDGTLAWSGGAPGVGLPAIAQSGGTDVDVSSLDPGRYVVSFFVRFARGGDASYGVLLDKDIVEG
jgi:hypothetical protein